MYTVDTVSGCSAARLARFVRDEEAGGSNPLTPTIFLPGIRGMIHIYVLRGSSGKRYVGITNNQQRCLSKHQAHRSKDGLFLGDCALVLYEEYPDHPPAGQGRAWLDKSLG